jgi:hypothetical protein
VPNGTIAQTFKAFAQYDSTTGRKTTDVKFTTLRLSMPKGTLSGGTVVNAEAIPNADNSPRVRIVVTAVNMSVTDPNITISVFRASDNALVGSCSGSATCVATDSPANLTMPTDLSYFAIVSDDKHQGLASAWTTVNVLPLYGPNNFGNWVFTAAEYGTKVSLTHDQETQDRNMSVSGIVVTYDGMNRTTPVLPAPVAPGTAVHLKTTAHGEQMSDTVTVELRDIDGTVYKTCSGTGEVTCETDAVLSGEYKNHFFMTRVTDQMGRTLEYRSPNPVYVGGTQGFGGSVRLIADKTSVARGGTVQLASKIMGETTPIAQITTDIYNAETGVLVANCTWTTECKTKTIIDTSLTPLSFYVIAFDRQGREMRATVIPTPITATSAQ